LTKPQRKQYGALSRADQSKFIDAIIEKRAKAGKLIDFNSLPTWLPNSIRTIIRKATAVDPARRYPTASDLCADLHEYGARTVNWTADDESVRVDVSGKSYRIVEDKSSMYICEKKLTAMWRRHNAILPGSQDSVIMALRSELGI
jgi:eukaryotic-like serine/threonine-protein kinase